jgi:tetratricopeptide (TPR) repeat protein
MKLINLLGSGLVSGALALMCTVALAATPTFKDAVNEYNAGKYKEALAKFSVLMKSNRTNPTLHYYSAMCHQNLGQMGEARTEYQYVVTNGDAGLQGYAQRALASLDRKSTPTASSPYTQINGMGMLTTVSPNISGMKVAPPPPGNPQRQSR